jgi:hypothetical protein
VVLYGSGAEGKLRASSDVDVILVLAKFEPAAADRIRGPLSLASPAIRLRAMFLMEDEIGAASEAFAQKFIDICGGAASFTVPIPSLQWRSRAQLRFTA